MLSKKEKDSILEELTYFDVSIAYESGNIVTNQDGIFVDEEENIYEKSEVVTISYNESIKRRITTSLKPLLRMRGVKDLENIDKNDSEVKALLKDIKLKNKQSGMRNITNPEDEAVAIQRVIDKHEPQYQAAIFQVIIWAMLRNDIFSVTKNGIESRIKVDISDDYWETKIDGDELDALALGTALTPIVRKNSEPLEIMIAITTQLVNKYEQFAVRMGELAAIVFANISSTTQDYDDAGMFRRELVAVLPIYLVRKDNDGNWLDAGVRVYFNSEKDREVERPEEKAS